MSGVDVMIRVEDTNAFVAFLDLPQGSRLSFDGQVVHLKSDDFVGIHSIPTKDFPFHLFCIRACVSGKAGAPQLSNSVVAYCLFAGDGSMVRKYDPALEEISARAVDNQTAENLKRKVQTNTIEPHRLVEASSILTMTASDSWQDRTRYISVDLLKQRGVQSKAKLVPGSYSDGSTDVANMDSDIQSTDGSTIAYPPIPFWDSGRGLRSQRHAGTRDFLSKLNPLQRTSILVDANPCSRLLSEIISMYYTSRWTDLLGDLQLSFLLFQELQCFSSLEHWRDLVALLCHVEPTGLRERHGLYSDFLDVLLQQTLSIEKDFFEDLEVSADNFLVSSIRRLVSNLQQLDGLPRLQRTLERFRKVLSSRFPESFAHGQSEVLDDEVLEDDEDAPIIVSNEDIRESMERSSEQVTTSQFRVAESVRKDYPLLVAAILPHEDILMTCARCLDEKKDVSLVREAAAYLENIENRTSR